VRKYLQQRPKILGVSAPLPPPPGNGNNITISNSFPPISVTYFVNSHQTDSLKLDGCILILAHQYNKMKIILKMSFWPQQLDL
jgi:hypothetical protein